MCGIVSLYNKRQMPVRQETISAMTGVILHRGPDDDGFHLEDNIALGFRRLSIIDVEGGSGTD